MATRWRWPPGQCGRICIGVIPQSNLSQQARGPSRSSPGGLDARFDVGSHRSPVKQPRLLKDHAETAGCPTPASIDPAAVGPFQSGRDMEQRCLADARRTNQRDQLALLNLEFEVAQNLIERPVFCRTKLFSISENLINALIGRTPSPF